MRSAYLIGCRRRRPVVTIPVILGKADMIHRFNGYIHQPQYVRPPIPMVVEHAPAPRSRWPRVLVALGVAFALGAFIAAFVIVMVGISRVNHPGPVFVTPSSYSAPGPRGGTR